MFGQSAGRVKGGRPATEFMTCQDPSRLGAEERAKMESALEEARKISTSGASWTARTRAEGEVTQLERLLKADDLARRMEARKVVNLSARPAPARMANNCGRSSSNQKPRRKFIRNAVHPRMGRVRVYHEFVPTGETSASLSNRAAVNRAARTGGNLYMMPAS